MQVHIDLYNYIEDVGANWRNIGIAINVKGAQIKYSMKHETLGVKAIRKIADLVDFDLEPYEAEMAQREKNIKTIREVVERKKAEEKVNTAKVVVDEEPALKPAPLNDVVEEQLTSTIGETLKAKKIPVADVAMVAHMAKAVVDKKKDTDIVPVVDATITVGQEIEKAKPIPVPEELPAMADVQNPGEPEEYNPFSDCNEMYKEACNEDYEMEKKDMVNHPEHYASADDSGIECIDAMVAAFGKAAVAKHCQITAFKYLWRAGRKFDAAEDMQKSQWYTNKAVELMK